MSQKLKAILLMITSALAFAVMQLAISATGGRIPIFQQLFFRNLIAASVAYVAIRKNSLPAFGTKGNRAMLIIRSVTGYMGMIALFYAAANADQGDVATISKMSPFIISILAYFFMKEKITKYQIIGLFVAAAGAYFVSNPQYNSNTFPIVIAFISCLFTGVAYTLVGALKGREAPPVIIFFFSLFSTIASFPLMLATYVTPSFSDFALLMCIGLSAAVGQITLTYSYANAPAGEVSIYNYSGIVFSMILGYIFLDEILLATSFVGAILVVLAGIIVFFGNKHLEKQNRPS